MGMLIFIEYIGFFFKSKYISLYIPQLNQNFFKFDYKPLKKCKHELSDNAPISTDTTFFEWRAKLNFGHVYIHLQIIHAFIFITIDGYS